MRWSLEARLHTTIPKGGQSDAVVTHPDANHQDVGSNPAAARNEKNRHWADPCTEGAPIVWQDLSGRPAM